MASVLYVCGCGRAQSGDSLYWCRHCSSLRCQHCVAHEVCKVQSSTIILDGLAHNNLVRLVSRVHWVLR
jgi:hypothetical protein